MSDYMRLTGLATGLDTDNMIKQMMKPYVMKMEKVSADRQRINWRQELYRDIIKDVNKINYDFLDIIGGEKNVSNLEKAYIHTMEDKEGTSAIVKGNTSAMSGRYKIDVKSVASGAKVLTKDEVNNHEDFKLEKDEILEISYGSKGKDGIKDTITVELNAGDSLKTIFNKIEKETKGKVVAKYSELTKSISIETKDTGANMYLDIDSKVSVKQADGTIGKTGESGFLEVLGIERKESKDAVFDVVLPGGNLVTGVKSSKNTYTADGVVYNFIDTGVTTFNLNKNVDDIYNRIKGFVDEYNKLVDKVNIKVSENKNRDFKPLTDEQRKELKQEEIKKWEDKCKEGILRGDADLQNMMTRLRRAFFDDVEGVTSKFGKSIGVSTSRDYSKQGKIEINEFKFKEALKEDTEKVLSLFTKKSDIPYSATNQEKRSERYKEEGIFQRVRDVFLDYTRTLGYGSDKKGILIEKAGMKDEYGSFNEFTNLLSKEIKLKDKMIIRMQKDVALKEKYFYNHFSRLEVIMNKMNAQSNWLMGQLGMGAK